MKRISMHNMLMCCAVAGLAACQAATLTAPQPAVLTEVTPAAMETMTSVLARAVGRARVELGPSDLTQQSAIPVLPPPPGTHENRSLAMPVIFDLVIREGRCFVKEREGNRMHALPGVACRPAASRDKETVFLPSSGNCPTVESGPSGPARRAG